MVHGSKTQHHRRCSGHTEHTTACPLPGDSSDALAQKLGSGVGSRLCSSARAYELTPTIAVRSSSWRNQTSDLVIGRQRDDADTGTLELTVGRGPVAHNKTGRTATLAKAWAYSPARALSATGKSVTSQVLMAAIRRRWVDWSRRDAIRCRKVQPLLPKDRQFT